MASTPLPPGGAPRDAPEPASVKPSTCGYSACVEPSRFAADFTCAGCRRVTYCAPACQKADWKRHKPGCMAAAADEAVARVEGALFELSRPAASALPLAIGGDSVAVEDVTVVSSPVVRASRGPDFSSRAAALVAQCRRRRASLTPILHPPRALPARVLALQTVTKIERYAGMVTRAATDDERLAGTQAFRKLLSAGACARGPCDERGEVAAPQLSPAARSGAHARTLAAQSARPSSPPPAGRIITSAP